MQGSPLRLEIDFSTAGSKQDTLAPFVFSTTRPPARCTETGLCKVALWAAIDVSTAGSKQDILEGLRGSVRHYLVPQWCFVSCWRDVYFLDLLQPHNRWWLCRTVGKTASSHTPTQRARSHSGREEQEDQRRRLFTSLRTVLLLAQPCGGEWGFEGRPAEFGRRPPRRHSIIVITRT